MYLATPDKEGEVVSDRVVENMDEQNGGHRTYMIITKP